MAPDCVHNHPEFLDLIRIVAEQKGIAPALVEKDYWIMHCLYGLQQLGFKFELKGGTSLSKGHGIIHRFSEDIDIHIEPPSELHVKTARNQTKHSQVESRRKFYEWLVKTIEINGIEKVARDTAFDGTHLFSGGIGLFYRSITPTVDDLREVVLLEAGFDTVTPNTPKDISSGAETKTQRNPLDSMPAKAQTELARNANAKRSGFIFEIQVDGTLFSVPALRSGTGRGERIRAGSECGTGSLRTVITHLRRAGRSIP